MTFQIAFLPVGNADCIVLWSGAGSASVVDVPEPKQLSAWLKSNAITEIERVYITHPHRDHFAPLEDFVGFVEEWLHGGGKLKRLILGEKAIQAALAAAGKLPPESRKQRRLKHALGLLGEWHKSKRVRWQGLKEGADTIHEAQYDVDVLHSSPFFLSADANETSLVLRVSAGSFSALLLADLEGAGLKECAQRAQEQPCDFKSNVVKIPHHGGLSGDGKDLTILLKSVDAEVAVLSVGSKNPYGHVRPELFRVLTECADATTGRKLDFLCTEVTKTCMHGAAEGATTGRRGLDERYPCAGEITIRVANDGTFAVSPSTDHERVLSAVPHAACRGRLLSGSRAAAR